MAVTLAQAKLFQSTRPMGAGHGQLIPYPATWLFQSSPPMWGETRASPDIYPRSAYFNPPAHAERGIFNHLRI